MSKRSIFFALSTIRDSLTVQKVLYIFVGYGGCPIRQISGSRRSTNGLNVAGRRVVCAVVRGLFDLVLAVVRIYDSH